MLPLRALGQAPSLPRGSLFLHCDRRHCSHLQGWLREMGQQPCQCSLAQPLRKSSQKRRGSSTAQWARRIRKPRPDLSPKLGPHPAAASSLENGDTYRLTPPSSQGFSRSKRNNEALVPCRMMAFCHA
uniref:Uncharacterized protein n=1 Tax=Rousettus aegyptiacus TaxID=9407 RepID=A0A7J8IKY2_ROUAE|nr:hypothetical protein HJG63_010547 [Rousettus aegyptiacus]